MKEVKTRIDEVTIEGRRYVPAESAQTMAVDGELGQYYIVRTQNAGVFAGYIESRNNLSIIMRRARRLWYWDGACSLSQLAMEGVSKPENCKFPCEVNKVELFQVIEIIDCTKTAKESIAEVDIWKQ
jgi:hypothetical protein